MRSKRGNSQLANARLIVVVLGLALLGLLPFASACRGGLEAPPSETATPQRGLHSSFDALPAPLKGAILTKLDLSPDSSLVVIYADDRLEIAYVPADNSFFVSLLRPGEEEYLQPLTERFLSAHGVRDFTTVRIVYRNAP